jgi:hypothetical protein
MLAPPETHASFEEAGEALVPFALAPANWRPAPEGEEGLDEASLPASYQRQVGGARVAAVVQVPEASAAELHVLIRSPGLSLQQTADLLERLLRGRLTLTVNSEWRVETDARRGVRFSRPYTAPALRA